MSKTITWILIILLIAAVFLLIPLFLPSEENYMAENVVGEESYTSDSGFGEDDGDIDIDFKKKWGSKSARSVGGSRSFRSGK